jgi:Tfp pilus assembly protein PilV
MKIREWVKIILHTRGEQGVALVEAIIAVLLLGGAILTMILSMSGGAMAVQENEHEVTAQSLARTQMEYIKNVAYNPSATTYSKITAPTGYSITVTVAAVPGANTNIQKITVDILLNGSTIFSLQDYKVNR